jgi:asparagine synthase (glutamine-hydrolysing)
VRSPLLDAAVVRFALRLPSALRIREGRAKWPLRALLARRLPTALFDRPKQGFSVPIGAWLRGPLRDWAEALLAPDRLRDQGLLDVVAVRRIWEAHARGGVQRPWLVWNLLMLEAWMDARA